MVRRYDEVIEVRESPASGPALFLWRGRVYSVRSILGHWRERRAWWLEGCLARWRLSASSSHSAVRSVIHGSQRRRLRR